MPDAPQAEFIALPLEKVLYGAGSLDRLAAEIDRLECRRAFIITGRSLATQTPLIGRVETVLGGRHAGTYTGIQQHVPESGITEAVRLARECQADVLVSVGGGSPVDAAKSIAHRLAEGKMPFLPQIAIPTTLSAAEFSHVAGYTDEASRSKTGFSDVRATPRVVILDPETTLSTPLWLWLSSGIRSLDHAVETLYHPGYHPINDLLAMQAIRDLFEFLPRSKAGPQDPELRHRCQIAAWMSYFSPASVSAHTGLSHTLGKRIGATYGVPHGVTSCILLAHVMRYKAGNEKDAACLKRMAQALQLVSDQAPDREAALASAGAVAGLVAQLDLPNRLRDVNVPQDDLEQIARLAASSSQTPAGLLEILRNAW